MTWLRRHAAHPALVETKASAGMVAARQAVQESHTRLEAALSARQETITVTASLRELRERNHFAETITASIRRGNSS